MRKELIFELVESAYGDVAKFNKFVTTFVESLKDEGYHEMAKVVQEIQYRNTRVRPAQARSASTDLYSVKMTKEIQLIKKGYDLGIVKSVILHGEPGTGKTFFAEHLAANLNLQIYKLALSEIMDSRYGETIRRFESFVKSHLGERCVLFIDEAESLFSARGKKNDVFESDRILTTALQLFDNERQALVVIATNLFKNLDPAITRRFDLQINFDEFEIDVKKIFKAKMKRWPLDIAKAEIDEIAKLIASNLTKPKFSDVDFLSRKFSLERIAGHSFAEAKQAIEKSLTSFNKQRVSTSA